MKVNLFVISTRNGIFTVTYEIHYLDQALNYHKILYQNWLYEQSSLKIYDLISLYFEYKRSESFNSSQYFRLSESAFSRLLLELHYEKEDVYALF